MGREDDVSLYWVTIVILELTFRNKLGVKKEAVIDDLEPD